MLGASACAALSQRLGPLLSERAEPRTSPCRSGRAAGAGSDPRRARFRVIGGAAGTHRRPKNDRAAQPSGNERVHAVAQRRLATLNAACRSLPRIRHGKARFGRGAGSLCARQNRPASHGKRGVSGSSPERGSSSSLAARRVRSGGLERHVRFHQSRGDARSIEQQIGMIAAGYRARYAPSGSTPVSPPAAARSAAPSAARTRGLSARIRNTHGMSASAERPSDQV